MECALLEDNASNLAWGDLLQEVLPNSDGGDNNGVQGGGGAVSSVEPPSVKTNVDANDKTSLLLLRNLTKKVLNVFHNNLNTLRNLYRINNCLNLDLEITFNGKLVESYSSSL